ncbi:MAG: hypothetical protein L3J36_11510 [Rhodobacteraceae bacterium]|nr:hypothetical protein [Paracoccaceae bacterium]
MELVADFLLVAGALGAGFFCYILARRLNRFNDLEKGVGGAVALLSAQVDDLTKTLVAARETSDGSNVALDDLTGRAEAVAQRLELMMASMHDIPSGNHVAPAQTGTAQNTGQNAGQSTGQNTGKPDGGPMFVRHERNNDGVRQ